MSNETSPRKRRKIEPQNDHVSDDDRVSVMAGDDFEESEEDAQLQEDYSSRIFNPEPVSKDKLEPYEAIVNYVNQHFSKMFSNNVKSVIKEEVGVPNIKNFMVPEINPQIWNSAGFKPTKIFWKETTGLAIYRSLYCQQASPLLSCGSKLFFLMKIWGLKKY